MASNDALLALMRETRRRFEAKTERPRGGSDYIDRQRRAAERPSPELREGEPLDWHDGESQTRSELARVLVSDNLSEAISERLAIEAEVDALVGDHDDVDTLAERLPTIPVPSETAPIRVRLWWLVRRWWHGWRERRRGRA